MSLPSLTNITVGFFFYVVRHYADILRWVVDGFIFAGEKVGAGTAVNFATLRDPGPIFLHGLNISKPLADKIFADMDSSWMGIPSVDSLWLLVCIICTLFAFAIMSIQVFVTYLEYLLVASAGFILIPFGMFKPTAFMAERVCSFPAEAEQADASGECVAQAGLTFRAASAPRPSKATRQRGFAGLS
jgi:type IV secretion system protein TrbL